MNANGGAFAVIAGQCQSAILETAELGKLVEEMKNEIKVWSSQTVEAKRGSLIVDAAQRIEDGEGRQEIRAEDTSTIRGVKQTLKKTKP
jgi:hypothetical protein